MSDHLATWWADGNAGRARKTGIAGLVVTLALTAVSTLVWLSPQDSRPSEVIGAVIGELTAPDDLQQQYDQLLSDYTALQSDLEASSAAGSDLEDRLAELEAALADANDALAGSRTQNAQLSSALDAAEASSGQGSGGSDGGASAGGDGGAGSGSAGSGSSGSSGSGTSGSGSSGSGSPGGDDGDPSPSPSEPTTPSDPAITAPPLADLVDPSEPYYGMYTAQAPFNWATYDDTSSKIGYRPNVVGYFGGWDEDFRATAVERAWQRGTLPILTWESRPIGSQNNVVDEPEYSLPVILDGAFDDYLRQYARDIVETGLPLGLRFNHEMNGTWYPWNETRSNGDPINGNSPGDYVQVWQHVHDIFEAEGANEYVFWIWAPNIANNLPSVHQSPEHLASLYPGDDYVDWVGLSGYLRPPYKQDQTFTFSYTFDRSLDQLRDLTDKPIFLAEIGASETGGRLTNGDRVPDGHKGRWIASLFDGLADPANDDIIGFAWFNLAITTYVEGSRSTNDWRVESRRDSLEEFSDGLLDPANEFQLQPY